MGQRILSGSIALTKIKHVKMTCKGKTGPVEGIFIPFVVNKLTLGKPAEDGSVPVYVPIRVIVKDEQDDKGQNGFIAKSLSTEDYKALKTDEEKEEAKAIQPILGSIKEFATQTQDSAGAASANNFEPEDDLPF